MILSQILEEKEREVLKKKAQLPLGELKRELEKTSPAKLDPSLKDGKVYPLGLDFKRAISEEGMNLIAELKRKSPSKGVLRRDFKAVGLAVDYVAAGAKALSVLTDEKFFGGDIKFIKEIKKEVNLPILQKDFIIDEYQIYEAKVASADAILLIAHILTEEQLRHFKNIADGLEMDVVCEIHSEEDMDKVLSMEAAIIGINNRNLHDFKVDLETTPRLIRHIPQGSIIISESGIKTYKDVMYLKSLGVNAVLIGETFMKAQDIVAKVREVMEGRIPSPRRGEG